METPRPGWRSPLPYIQLQRKDFFSSLAIMDNIHPTAAKGSQIHAHTRTYMHVLQT